MKYKSLVRALGQDERMTTGIADLSLARDPQLVFVAYSELAIVSSIVQLHLEHQSSSVASALELEVHFLFDAVRIN